MLGRGQATRGMRSFIAASGIWGAWHQFVGIGSTVFTGYALFLGADESFIAVMVALAYLLAPVQLASSLVGARISKKKHFVIGAGICEMLVRGSLILIPFIFAPRSYLGAMIGLVAASLVFAYLLSPTYNTWMVNTIPEDYRARFTSQQTIVRTLAATIFGFAVGQFVDYFPEASRQDAFVYVFAIGTVIGLCGFLPVSRAPFPKETPNGETKANLRSLVERSRTETSDGRRSFLAAGLGFGHLRSAVQRVHAGAPEDVLHRDFDLQRSIHGDKYRRFGGIHLTGVRRDPHQCSAADRHGRFAPGRSRLVGCPRRLGGSGGSFPGRRLAMRSWKRIGSWATASSSTR